MIQASGPGEAKAPEANGETEKNANTAIGKTTLVSTGQTTESGKPKIKYVRKVAPGNTDRADGIISLPSPISELVYVDANEAPAMVANDSKVYSRQNPFYAKVIKSKYLTHSDALKQVVHVELDVADMGHKFLPGDAFGVVPPNPEWLVNGILHRLSLKGSATFVLKPTTAQKAELIPAHFTTPITLFDALRHHCDVTSVPRKTLLRVLAEYTTDPEQKAELLRLCSIKDSRLYERQIEGGAPSLLDLLNQYPSSNPPISLLFDILLPIATRWYSVCNAPSVSPGVVECAYTVVKTKIRVEPYTREKEGLCSSWMTSLLTQKGYLRKDNVEALAEQVNKLALSETGSLTFPIFPREEQLCNFRLPKPDVPTIMIGPGTGVAPFRGFCQERRFLKTSQKMELAASYLFTGCRNESLDFLFKDELQSFEPDGTITKLVSAFSRQTEEVVYVQHRMKELGSTLFELMDKQNAICYICGDSTNMSKDVQAAWLQIIQEHKKCDLATANQVLSDWVATQRYRLDVW